MAWWFRSVFAIVVFANVAGAASVAVWSLPRTTALGSREVLPFALGLLLTLIARLCAWRVFGRPPQLEPSSGPSPGAGSTSARPTGLVADTPGWALAANVALALGGVLGASGLVSVSLATGLFSDGAGADRRSGSVVILAVNDIYRIEGIEGGKFGGLARLRTLRADLERQHPGRVLLIHGGDAIFPSLLSRLYGGAQMIDVLNLMDGDARAGRLDERMFVVFGNHEFEGDGCKKKGPVLQRRVAESDFFWLHPNIVVTPCPDGQPRLAGTNLLHGRIVDVDGLRVGLFGLTIDPKQDYIRPLSARDTARAAIRDLRRRGADVVVAVTHLNAGDDVSLLEEFRREGLDLIIGGHDHTRMSLPSNDPEPRIFKADSDARTAWIITLSRDRDGRVQVAGRWRMLDAGVAKDAAVDRKVTELIAAHADKFCQAAAADPHWIGVKPVSAACLDERLAVADTPLVASEEKIRSSETSLGNWVADQMFAAFKVCGVDGAFINAGGLRLNHDLPKDSDITMRHLEELVEYKTTLRVYKLTHAQLWKALANSVSEPGAGRWLQVSDQIAFSYQPVDQHGAPARLLKAVVRRAGKPSIDVTESSKGDVRIVANDFLQTSSIDGYDTILPSPDTTPCAAPSDLKQVLYAAFKTQGRIKAVEPGRICTDAEARGGHPCLATQPGTTP
jgi:2',3'-cyclic-nucleotide 2'-phosphodiesterase (5'-nucleotidase family)